MAKKKAIETSVLFTPAEVAKILRVHPQTVKSYILEGKLEAVKIGYSTTRIEAEALQKFVQSRKGDYYFDFKINRNYNE